MRSTNPVVVGDIVRCERDEAGEPSSPTSSAPHYIIRRASESLEGVAHHSRQPRPGAAGGHALFSPETAPEFIDRFLVTCEAYKVPVTILLAKADLAYDARGYGRVPRHIREGGLPRHRRLGHRGEGVDEVRKAGAGARRCCRATRAWASRPLVAAVERTAEVRTGEISRSHQGTPYDHLFDHATRSRGGA